MHTTSATVGWRSRLMVCLNSHYEPREAALLLAADHPYKRVVNVELLADCMRCRKTNLGELFNPLQQMDKQELWELGETYRRLLAGLRLYHNPLLGHVFPRTAFLPDPKQGFALMVEAFADLDGYESRGVFMDTTMTFGAYCDQVLLGVAPGMAAELLVMDFEIL